MKGAYAMHSLPHQQGYPHLVDNFMPDRAEHDDAGLTDDELADALVNILQGLAAQVDA